MSCTQVSPGLTMLTGLPDKFLIDYYLFNFLFLGLQSSLQVHCYTRFEFLCVLSASMDQPIFAMGISHSIPINDAERSLVTFTWAVGFFSWILGRYQLLRNFCKVNVGWTPTKWSPTQFCSFEIKSYQRRTWVMRALTRPLFFLSPEVWPQDSTTALDHSATYWGTRQFSDPPTPPPPLLPFRSALAISNHVLYIHFRSCC